MDRLRCWGKRAVGFLNRCSQMKYRLVSGNENCYCSNENELVAMCSNRLFAFMEDNAKLNLDPNIAEGALGNTHVKNIGK